MRPGAPTSGKKLQHGNVIASTDLGIPHDPNSEEREPKIGETDGEKPPHGAEMVHVLIFVRQTRANTVVRRGHAAHTGALVSARVPRNKWKMRHAAMGIETHWDEDHSQPAFQVSFRRGKSSLSPHSFHTPESCARRQLCEYAGSSHTRTRPTRELEPGLRARSPAGDGGPGRP